MATRLDWNLADVWEKVAEVVPDAPAQIQGERMFTWSEFDRRANGVAAALLDKRASPRDRVAQYLRNGPEYLEVAHAALKVGIPAVNTNYRYGGDELLYLWENADVSCVVFHASFTERVDELRARASSVRQWIHVDDGTLRCPHWALPYEAAAGGCGQRSAVRSPWGRSSEDLFLLYTGGTTGMPKGVMWRSIDFLEQVNDVGGVSYPLEEGVAAIPSRLTSPGRVHISACPMMHGTGLFGAFITMHQGGCVVSLNGHNFDAAELLSEIEKHSVSSLAITGEVFARRILDAASREPDRWDTSSVRNILSSGGILSEACKRDLLEYWPQATILDGFSSSEGFGMGWSVATKSDIPATAAFSIGPDVMVLDAADQPISPGSGVIGRLAVSGRVPQGYYKDPDKSAATFVEIGGRRMALPGDHATVDVDGRIHLVGRNSLCINSGGEKIYTEEVEAVLLDHPAVTDALVVGIPDPVWGQAVAAVVSVDTSAPPSPADLVAHVKKRLAGYKAPKEIAFVDAVPRGPNGKPDYAAARNLAERHRNARPASTDLPSAGKIHDVEEFPVTR